jgi:hypothetical protein
MNELLIATEITFRKAFLQLPTAEAHFAASGRTVTEADLDNNLTPDDKAIFNEFVRDSILDAEPLLKAALLVHFAQRTVSQKIMCALHTVLPADEAIKNQAIYIEPMLLQIESVSRGVRNPARKSDGTRRDDYDATGRVVFADVCNTRGLNEVGWESFLGKKGVQFSDKPFAYFTDLGGAQYAAADVNIESRESGHVRYNRLKDFLRAIAGTEKLSAQQISECEQIWNDNHCKIKINGTVKTLLVLKAYAGVNPYILSFKIANPLTGLALKQAMSHFKYRENQQNTNLETKLAASAAVENQDAALLLARMQQQVKNAAIREIMKDFDVNAKDAMIMYNS